jgi:hypothetical protein
VPKKAGIAKALDTAYNAGTVATTGGNIVAPQSNAMNAVRKGSDLVERGWQAERTAKALNAGRGVVAAGGGLASGAVTTAGGIAAGVAAPTALWAYTAQTGRMIGDSAYRGERYKAQVDAANKGILPSVGRALMNPAASVYTVGKELGGMFDSQANAREAESNYLEAKKKFDARQAARPTAVAPSIMPKKGGLQQIVSAREAQEDWGLKEKVRELFLSKGDEAAAGLAPLGVAAERVSSKGVTGKDGEQLLGQLKEVLSAKRPPVTNMDHVMRPLYTPTGYNPMVGAGVAAGMGALSGGIYHFMKERAANADETVTGRPQEHGSLLKRTLVGAGIGAGTSLLSNYLLHKVPGDGTPNVDLMKSPFKDFRAEAPAGALKTGSFNVVDAMTMSSDDMDVVGKDYLKRMIMVEPGLNFDDKLRLMQQVDNADRYSSSVNPTSLMGVAGGALTGFLMAKSRGSGPVTTGLMTSIGSIAGHMFMKDRGPKPGDISAGQPGFKMY